MNEFRKIRLEDINLRSVVRDVLWPVSYTHLHADVSTTLRRYIHPSMDMKRQQMERLQTLTICGQNYGQKTGEIL